MFSLPLALVAIAVFYLASGSEQMESAFYVYISRSEPTLSRNRRHEAMGRSVALILQLAVVFVFGGGGVDAMRDGWKSLEPEARELWWRRAVGHGSVVGFWCWRGGAWRTEWLKRWCVKSVEWMAGTTGEREGEKENAVSNHEVGTEEQPLLDEKE